MRTTDDPTAQTLGCGFLGEVEQFVAGQKDDQAPIARKRGITTHPYLALMTSTTDLSLDRPVDPINGRERLLPPLEEFARRWRTTVS